MKKYGFAFTLLSSFCLPAPLSAQTTHTGLVLDRQTRESLPFVNIGIKRKNMGTVSSATGNFSFQALPQHQQDTLTFSMVGYYDLAVPIRDLLPAGTTTIHLRAKAAGLKTVTISASKIKERDFGIKNNHTLFNFTDGSVNQNDIFEIAQLVKFNTGPAKITSLNLYVTEPRKDSAIFRINFYSLENGKPSKRLIEKNIIQKLLVNEGWLKFDLSQQAICLEGEVVVGLEFIPGPQKNTPVRYGLKLGGSSKSFVRNSSQGDWEMPPHHYRMFITALVADEKNKPAGAYEEEKEAVPAARLFSTYVKDSFSIFVHLPKEYGKKAGRLFPAVYLLDANAYFDALSAFQAEEAADDKILVGIGYKDVFQMDRLRDRDFTFPQALPQDSFLLSGGGDQFLSFIHFELIPYVDKTYRTDPPNRSLMGHSLGAYFTLYALLRELPGREGYFKSYVAASPSLHYGDRYLEKEFGKEQWVETAEKKLFLSYGGREDEEEGAGAKGMEEYVSLVKLLSGAQFKSLNINSEIHPNARHMETALPSFKKALKSIK